jgi:hypothetical protein
VEDFSAKGILITHPTNSTLAHSKATQTSTA